MARSLDRGMFERRRDIQIAASSDSLRGPRADTATKRALMERMQATTRPTRSSACSTRTDMSR
jgi:hypothetical protein